MTNKMRSLLTVLGVIIGVTAVVLLVSIGEGARKMISDEFSGLGTNILALFPGKTSREGGMHMGASTVRKIVYDDAGILERRSQFIQHAVPVMIGTAWVKYQGKTRDTYIVGTTEPYFDIRNLYIDTGRRITEADNEARRRVCVLGRTVKYDVFGDKNALGEIVTVGDGKFRVVGIMKKKGVALGFDIDDLVFIPISASRDLFDTDALFNVTIKVKSVGDVAQAKRDILQIMKRRHANRDDFTILSQDEMMAAMGKVLNILTGVLAGIAAISLIVGGIGIMNVMLISIKERTREIGIRKAVGARDRDILMQFLLEAVLLSMIGGIGGIVLSLAIALFLMTFVEAVPVKLTYWSMALAFLFSAMVGVFFGVYPARKAAESDPIVALRYE
jgi:putative ABC transport system permease protein